MSGRCVATNPAGARCTLAATHGTDGHEFATDAYLLGWLHEAVRSYLAGNSSREHLAREHAAIQAEAGLW